MSSPDRPEGPDRPAAEAAWGDATPVSDRGEVAPDAGAVIAEATPAASGVVAAPYPPSPSSGIALPSPDDAPILPPELTAQAALEGAIGAPSNKARKRARAAERDQERDAERDPSEPPRNRKTMVIAAGSIVGGLGIATLIFLGRANAQRFEITCDTAHVYAEQGRSFPPWGTKKLFGPEWAPIALPANAECRPRETENEAELATWYLELLVERATTTLAARDLLDAPGADASGKATNQLDYVATQLDQALLLARDPGKRDQRKEVTRLQGDVDYWRAAGRLREASAVLLDAAKQFEVANQKHPRHATDAAAWSSFLHRLADELHAGPSGAPPVTAPAAGAPTASVPPVPVGSALPVDATGSAADSAAPPPASPSVPAGGVLL